MKGIQSTMNKQENLIVVRGGGDLATGVVHRLMQSGFLVVILEIEKPTVIRRTVAFAQAVFQENITIEEITAKRVYSVTEALQYAQHNQVPILVDPLASSINEIKPQIVIDAILAKKNLGTSQEMAPFVVGIGPGFCAGEDVHAVIETNRGHNLGRVFYNGCAEPDTGVPGTIGGFDYQRVLRAPADGIIKNVKEICANVKTGEVIAYVNEIPITSSLDGVLRGLITDGLMVKKNLKIGDVDPRCKPEYCYLISDKARAIGGGVLEAVMHFLSSELQFFDK